MGQVEERGQGKSVATSQFVAGHEWTRSGSSSTSNDCGNGERSVLSPNCPRLSVLFSLLFVPKFLRIAAHLFSLLRPVPMGSDWLVRGWHNPARSCHRLNALTSFSLLDGSMTILMLLSAAAGARVISSDLRRSRILYD